MIIGKAPLRMSFLGGGTDLPSYYRKFGGLVVSTSIDKYVFVAINPKFDERLRVSYSVTENVNHSGELKHPLVKTALELKNIRGGVEITSIADIPSGGTGLGSSSSFTVCLLQVLSAYNGEFCTPQDFAETASHIEINLCGEPIGKQDQYAAAFGGLNMIEFHQDDSVQVTPVVCNQEYLHKFERQTLCFYTGRTRSASDILQEQSARSRDDQIVIDSLNALKNLARDFVKSLYAGDMQAMGSILHEGWILKRGLSANITDTAIDRHYETARNEGAYGGKLLGAGGGGFLMVQAPEERHDAIVRALSGLRPVSLPFSTEGSRIIFYHPPKNGYLKGKPTNGQM
ncbi:GHMP kinase [Rhodoblastus sp.]|uniref:GHMP family kinase ATP-binding protein n=1 Tax=Rhodoblastus sp. TaxID=1962975 RepID=UPI0035AE6D7D